MHLAFENAPPPAPLATPVPPTPFTLTAGKDDTGLFKDARATFSHLLPGRPVLGLPPKQGEAPADVIVHLQDAPITVRYSFSPPAFSVPGAAEAARLTAESYSGWRSQSKAHVEFANPTWLAAWGVEAAAVATYDVAGGELREDLFVLARQGYVLTVAWTYPRGFVDDPAYAIFASVAEATMIWDPQRWEQRGRVWPESELWGAGLFARAKAKHSEAARKVSAAPSSRQSFPSSGSSSKSSHSFCSTSGCAARFPVSVTTSS